MGELGSLLTRTREARGLTLEDAERDTRISRRYLQALEAEQFEVIPAPVYARGFLRSYSQYLGLDPQEALAMFPREDDPEYQRAADANAPAPRASKESPVSPVSAARPTWRSAPPPQQEPLQPFDRQTEEDRRATLRPTPLTRPAKNRAPAPSPKDDPSWEPVIGIDIGVPTPANRIKSDPAAQTRSLVVAIVAIGVILGAVLVAILISNLGGGESPPPGTGIDATKSAGTEPAATTDSTATVAGAAAPGVVPTLIGLTEAEATQLLNSSGYLIRELREKSSAPKGTVFDQEPAAGTERAQGQTVTIAISDGQ
ncbi:MAG: helix-turn-helix domain-containing protein [Dehalococcoidia bacterium]